MPCHIIHNEVTGVQWNLSIVDTTGPRKRVLIREEFLFQRLLLVGNDSIKTRSFYGYIYDEF